MKEAVLAYLAGIVDGEGYVGITKANRPRCHGPVYIGEVQVRMGDDAAVRLLAETFGGSVRIADGSRGQRPMFRYVARSGRAETLLAALRPYLRVKAASAEAVLALRSLQAQRGLGRRRDGMPDHRARCLALHAQCRQLNHAPGWKPRRSSA